MGMGDAVLGAFLQVIFQKIADPLVEEYKRTCKVSKEIEALQRSVEHIRSLLRDAERRKVVDESLNLWLMELDEAVYEADDVVDEFLYGALKHMVEDRHNYDRYGRLRNRDKVRASFSSKSSVNILFRRRIAHRIEQIGRKLDNIAKKNKSLNPRLLDDGFGRHSLEAAVVRETSSLVSEPYVFGRSSEIENLITTLLASDESQPLPPPSSFSSSSSSYETNGSNLSVVPIVGIPGMGKTTLAQLIYNDDRVKERFDLRMWVFVSNDFDVKRLTKQMVQSVNSSEGKHRDAGNLDVLQNELSKILIGKRFLLVLDDVWDNDPSEWHEMRAPLIRGRRGSKILVTTRHSIVAKTVGTMEPFHLRGLSLDDCRSLLQKCASVHGDLQKSQISEAICRKIVDKLDGAPLVVKTVARILSSKSEGRWREILDNEIWQLPQNERGILPVLKLSYENLSPHLKRCFAYCSLFPKGYEFDKEKLVKLWIAQGYVQKPTAEKRAEDVGSDYFDELLSKSFFQKVDDRYVMYDLFHDLTRYVPNHGCVRIESEDGKHGLQKNSHHLSLSIPKLKAIVSQLNECNNMRSLLYISQYRGKYRSDIVELPEDLFAKLNSLRVLDLSGSNITALPESLGDMIHLRFLDLSRTKIRELPSTISKLYNLYALELKECHDLRELSNGVLNLINLHHLCASKEIILKLSNIGKLTSLQELELFNVSRKEGHKISELGSMNELRGKLSILNIQNVEDDKEANQAELKSKEHLDELMLEWATDVSSDSRRDWDCEGRVLEGLQPPKNLRVLSIYGNGGFKPPSWMDKFSVNHLTSITLRDCKYWEVLPPLGMLQYLVSLKIEYFLSVEQVGSEFYGNGVAFPSLEVLEIRHMHSLKIWLVPQNQGAFPCIQRLLIEDCPELQTINLPTSLKSLRLEKCPKLLINSNFALLQSLHLLSSFSCSFENSFPDLQSCVNQTLRHLKVLEELEICFCNETVTDLRWSQRPHWMPFNFAQGRAADELVLPNSRLNIHDGSDIRVFLLYAQNFPDYPDVYRRDVCLRIRNYDRENDHGYHSLSACLQKHLGSLKRLSVKGCPKIGSLLRGVLVHLPELEKLEIDDCQEVRTLAWFPQQHNFTSLKTLKIGNCSDLAVFPRLKLTMLEEVQVDNCTWLLSMDIHELVCLKQMEIGGCPNLSHELFTGRLTALSNLKLRRCPQLLAPPNAAESGLQQLISLQCLEISFCSDLIQLPTYLHALSSLKRLSILDCPKIIKLPETGLPRSLKELHIEGCHSLQERCQIGGSDWAKVAHILKKKINCPKCHPFRCRCNRG